MMLIDETTDLIPLIAIATAIIGLLIWIVKAQISMSKEFQPNGGSTMRDAIARIERDNHYLRDRLDQHIDQHGKGNFLT